jgi:hypothetical protein
MNEDADRMCRCGHPWAVHEHLRAGSDCGFCSARNCPRFRPTGTWWQRLAARLGWMEKTMTVPVLSGVSL